MFNELKLPTNHHQNSAKTLKEITERHKKKTNIPVSFSICQHQISFILHRSVLNLRLSSNAPHKAQLFTHKYHKNQVKGHELLF